MKKLKPYPSLVCINCALDALRKENRAVPKDHLATYHYDFCGVCGKREYVTEPRDYGYPKFEGYEKKCNSQ